MYGTTWSRQAVGAVRGHRKWGHSLWKSICFPMCAVSAYWGHLTAKNPFASTNGSDCSESGSRQSRGFSPALPVLGYVTFTFDRHIHAIGSGFTGSWRTDAP
jgi:hypothetical protein